MTDQLDPAFDIASTGATRRSVLRTAGLVALAGGSAAALAGCSSGTEAAAPPTAGTSSSAAESPTASSAPPSASESKSASASESSKPPAGTTVAKAEVPQGGGVVLNDKFVVTQPAAGEFKAYTAICTHAGCPVKQVKDGEIQCPCHGSRFSINDGAPVGGPAKAPLAAVKFVNSGDNIVIPD